jgi:hypothetical protein
MMDEYSPYIFLGIGAAVSVIGFFIKRMKEEIDSIKSKSARLEINQARNHERLANIDKLLEDRRHDIKKLFEKQ